MKKIAKRALLVFALLFTINIALISWSAAHLWNSYKNIPDRPLTKSEAEDIGNTLGNDVDDLYRYLSIPPFKQAAELAGLRIFDTKDEIRFAARNFPIFAGFDKTKRYMISFQNSAEARGTGGILGAYAIVEVNRAHVKVIKASSNLGLASISNLPIKHSDEYFALYGNNPGIWQNANLSPHFPYGAKNYLELWRLQTGENLDGVVATDPVALSYLLKAIGTVQLPDGYQINSENLVEDTLKTAYKRYENDNLARKEFLVTIMKATFERLLAHDFNPRKIPSALSRAIQENRLLFYSTSLQVEKELEMNRLGGSLREQADNQYRVVIQNTDASKLDYYLDRDVKVESIQCSPTKTTQVTIYLKNKVVNAQDLPAYVLTRADKGKPKNLVTGQHRFKVFVYGPYGSTLVGGSLGSGKNGNAKSASERGRPLFIEDIDLTPDGSEVVVAQFNGGIGKISYVDQPLVRPTIIKTIDKC